MKKKEEFLNWLNGRILDRGGMLDYTLANAIGVSQSTARRIMIGEKTPSIPQIVTMAYVFDDLEHLEELLDMAGYSDQIEGIRTTRTTTDLMKKHPDILANKDTSRTWWAYYEQRRGDW